MFTYKKLKLRSCTSDSKLCKGVHCADLDESQNLASIQPRTSPVKFARSSSWPRGRRSRPCSSTGARSLRILLGGSAVGGCCARLVALFLAGTSFVLQRHARCGPRPRCTLEFATCDISFLHAMRITCDECRSTRK